MIYNDGNSELHIRLHIAEMLKDKVEQDNFEELCNKVLLFVMNGIDLPKIKKTPAEEAADMLSKTFLFPKFDKNSFDKMIKEIEGGEIPKSKGGELKELCEKHIHESCVIKNHTCFICGYSTEFDCLIAGTNVKCNDSVTLGHTDVLLDDSFNAYFYVGIDIVKNI